MLWLLLQLLMMMMMTCNLGVHSKNHQSTKPVAAPGLFCMLSAQFLACPTKIMPEIQEIIKLEWYLVAAQQVPFYSVKPDPTSNSIAALNHISSLLLSLTAT